MLQWNTKNFVLPEITCPEDLERRFYLTDIYGSNVGCKRQNNGVFGPWVTISTSQKEYNGSPVIEIITQELTTLQLAELEHLYMNWWGILRHTSDGSTWFIIQCMHSHYQNIGHFTQTEGKTGV